jgi:hypothetical protein
MIRGILYIPNISERDALILKDFLDRFDIDLDCTQYKYTYTEVMKEVLKQVTEIYVEYNNNFNFANRNGVELLYDLFAIFIEYDTIEDIMEEIAKRNIYTKYFEFLRAGIQTDVYKYLF